MDTKIKDIIITNTIISPPSRPLRRKINVSIMNEENWQYKMVNARDNSLAFDLNWSTSRNPVLVCLVI